MSQENRKKKKSGSGLLVLIFLFLLAGGGWWAKGYFLDWQKHLGPVQSQEEMAQVFVVERGWSLTRIARELEERQLILSADSFVRLGKAENLDQKLQAGNYYLSPSMDARTILEELATGRIIALSFTVPEGFHLRQIAALFEEKGLSTQETFWEAVANAPFEYAFLDGLPQDETRLEGYLFPDTYTIPEGLPVEKIFDLMLKRFEEIYNSLAPHRQDMSLKEVVTLASIVENEARLDEERPLIASVFLNRLRDGWMLQSCATVQYHFESPKPRLLYVDLEIDSPYNTYVTLGLPPGPICSPGKASLEAVIRPAQSSYKFFVAKEDGSGGHVFTETLSQHNEAKWLIRN